mgnify:CR=1 FL=1
MARAAQHGGNVLEIAERHGLDASEIIDFSANINPLGMPDSLRQAIVDNLALAERYPDIEYRHLHRAIARHTGTPVEWCMAGNGATELIFSLVAKLAPRRALLPVRCASASAVSRARLRSDDQMAFEEGWHLTYNEILLRSTVKFLSNEAAQAHVQTGIETGDPLHLKAIKTLAKRRLLYGDQ